MAILIGTEKKIRGRAVCRGRVAAPYMEAISPAPDNCIQGSTTKPVTFAACLLLLISLPISCLNTAN